MRLNARAGTSLLQVQAKDLDALAGPTHYYMQSVNFTSPIVSSVNNGNNSQGVFAIDKLTGEITSLKSLVHFVDGHFV